MVQLSAFADEIAADPVEQVDCLERHGVDACAVLLSLLSVTMLAVASSTYHAGRRIASSPAPAVDTVDPNSAPWWELTVLPHIGQATAREIVSFRKASRHEAAGGDGAPVFLRTADLASVRGIGPVTLQRIGPYLSFPVDTSATRDAEDR